MAKMIHDNSIIGQKGIHLIEGIVLEMGFTWHPSNNGLEAGIDGFIEIRNDTTGEVKKEIILVQSKATEKPFLRDTKDSLQYLCDKRDIDYWMSNDIPVILIRSTPSTGKAYWVSLQEYFAAPSVRHTRKIKFDKKKDRFDVHSKDALIALAARSNNALNKLNKVLNPPESPFRLDLITSNNNTFIIPRESYPGAAEEHPLSFTLKIKKPTSTEPDRMNDLIEFDNLRNPIWLNEDEYEIAEASEILKPFLGERGRFGIIPIIVLFEIRLQHESADGDIRTDVTVRLKSIVESDEVIILSNENEKVPLVVVIRIDMGSGEASFTLSYHYEGLPLQVVEEAFRFRRRLNHEGTLDIFIGNGSANSVGVGTMVVGLGDAEQRILHTNIDGNTLGNDSQKTWDMIKGLRVISDRIQVNFMFPDRPVTRQEYDDIRSVAQILQTGESRSTNEFTWTVTATREKAEWVLKTATPTSLYQFGGGYEHVSITIFGQEIDLGVMEWYCGKIQLHKDSINELKQQLEDQSNNESFEITFVSASGEEIIERYGKWISTEVEQEIRTKISQAQ